MEHAELVRVPTTVEAVDWFVKRGLDAAAVVRQLLERFAAEHSKYRVLKGRFTAIKSCMALPKRYDEAWHLFDAFIEERHEEGFLTRYLG